MWPKNRLTERLILELVVERAVPVDAEGMIVAEAVGRQRIAAIHENRLLAVHTRTPLCDLRSIPDNAASFDADYGFDGAVHLHDEPGGQGRAAQAVHH